MHMHMHIKGNLAGCGVSGSTGRRTLRTLPGGDEGNSRPEGTKRPRKGLQGLLGKPVSSLKQLSGGDLGQLHN